MRGYAVFSIWNDGYPAANFVEAFRDKGSARRRIMRLLTGAPWRRATDYQIRRVRLPRDRYFESRR